MTGYFHTGPGPKFKQHETRAEMVARQIEDHYHTQLTANNTRELITVQRETLKMQHDAAIANLHALGQISANQDTTNSLLSSVAHGIDDLNFGVMELNQTAAEMLSGITEMSSMLDAHLSAIASAILNQRQTLEKIAGLLSRPYETQVLELLQETDHALKQGMRSSGQDQQAEFADAERLIEKVLDNPIGSRNYVAWFQRGWLKWKYKEDIAAAEDAFYQSQRLSQPKADLYHANSLRHLAYMQYLQHKLDAAYESAQKALHICPQDHDIRFDVARYAAKTGRVDLALSLLSECIDQRPYTIITMFSEEDFVTCQC